MIDGTTDDIEGAILAGPGATEDFEIVPFVFVQAVVLGTDVGEEERLAHGFTGPFVITSGTHVTTIIAGVIIVIVCGTRGFDGGIFGEDFLFSLMRAIGMGVSQMPRHPVGILRFGVVRDSKAGLVENLFWAIL